MQVDEAVFPFLIWDGGTLACSIKQKVLNGIKGTQAVRKPTKQVLYLKDVYISWWVLVQRMSLENIFSNKLGIFMWEMLSTYSEHMQFV